ncbi:uncharacterized protein (DUF2147 family) [Sphingomonas desiccabilis]|nr:uncharacterized protein (DUF2147 family) [Sphingomonas desiccabilis]
MMLTMLLAAAAVAAAPQPQDAALGRWKAETKNGIVEISRCGESICGRLISSDHLRTDPTLKDVKNSNPQLRSRPLKGMQILGGFKSNGKEWVDGTIYNADDGKTYSAKVTPVGANQLKVRGCVFVPLCKTQTWTRVR